MGLQPIHMIMLLVVVVVLFGRGRISGLMGDVAQGIKAFKKGMAEDDTGTKPTPQIDAAATPAVEADKQTDKVA